MNYNFTVIPFVMIWFLMCSQKIDAVTDGTICAMLKLGF